MYKETIEKLVNAAKTKAEMVNGDLGRYVLLSIMAGVYVGFGIILIFSIGAPMHAAGNPGTKALMGASFALALTLVIFAGSELFTGNNLFMTVGSLSKEVSWKDTWKVWAVSFLGNLAGGLLLAWVMAQTGLVSKSPLQEFVLSTTAAKMNAPLMELFFRGVLCNMLVCLAIWMATKAKEETAKLLLIFWCLFGFIGAGFEHSVANMTLLGMGLFIPHGEEISWLGYARNLIPVTLGNMVGGTICIGAMYWYVAQDKITRGEKHGVSSGQSRM